MLRKIFIFIYILMLSSTCTCYSYSGVIEGFRGMRWGDSVEAVNQSGVFETELAEINNYGDGLVAYRAKLTNPSLGGVSLSDNAVCYFINDKFKKITLYYGRNSDPEGAYNKLVSQITNIWGYTYDKKDKADTKWARWIIGDDYIIIESDVFYNGSRIDELSIGTERYLQEYKVRSNGF